MMASPGMYDAAAIRQAAINLFHGWGYNFYRRENQLRADDLMIRAKIGELLAAGRHSVEACEQAYRRECLPPPSRAKPLPDADALRNAQALEALARAIGALEGHIRALPVPENDRMTQRFRREAETLSRLAEADEAMTGRAEILRARLEGVSARAVLDTMPNLLADVAALESAIQHRRDMLAF